jgi:hypothetical protein
VLLLVTRGALLHEEARDDKNLSEKNGNAKVSDDDHEEDEVGAAVDASGSSPHGISWDILGYARI